jgi:hypothetical protein
MTNHRDSRLGFILSLAGATTLATACGPQSASQPASGGSSNTTSTGGSSSKGGSSAAGGFSGDEPACVTTGENEICEPSHFPFVERAFVATETCPGPDCHAPNPTLTEPETGTLCVSGTAPSHGAGLILLLFRDNADASQVLQAFNAEALGITGLSFTLDSPPPGGIIVEAGIVVTLDCPSSLFDCLWFGFTLPRLTEPGTKRVALVDFMQSDNQSAYQTFDTSSLSHIELNVGAGPYDFCIRDFKFLDASGIAVNP